MVTTWTSVPKPTFSGTVTINAGEPIGLLLALTYSDTQVIPGQGWTKITKASGTPWTAVPKAT